MILTHIRVISDGRPGHENQSIGLAQALARRTGARVEVVRLPAEGGLWRKCGAAKQDDGNRPQLIIGAGHRTHIPLLAAAWRFQAKSVVIMKPSLPFCLFDVCVVPRHDLSRPGEARKGVLATRGALNRIGEEPAAKTDTGLILIGGPSKHHGWDGTPLPVAVREIVSARPELAWTVADSRRTPEGFLGQVNDCGAAVVPHQETEPGWLPRVLGAAREVWVTEDSVSMIFEALTARARVGLLPMPVRNPSARTVKAVHDLLTDGYVRTLADWRANPEEWGNPPVLHETARCAEAIIRRFF